MKKRHIPALCAMMALLATATTACQSDDSDLYSYINDLENAAKDTVYNYADIAIDRSTLDESTTVENFNADDMVENYSATRTVNIAFADADATVSGATSGITITKSGAHVKITSTKSGVKYVLSGTSTDGSLLIYSENKFEMELAGLTLTNPSGSAINNQCKKTCYVVVDDNTQNTLTDGAGYATESAGVQAKGTFFSEGQLVFSGAGQLDVYANNKHGIASDDYVRLRKGTDIYVKVNSHDSTTGSAIKAKDGIYINGGVLNIENLTDGGKGINSEDSLIVTGGRMVVITSGASYVDTALSDTTSSAAIKTDSATVIKGGTLALLSTGEGGKGINTKANIDISGGTVNVVTLGAKGLSSPKGIKTTANMTMTGGYLCTFSRRATPLEVTGTLDYGTATYTLTQHNTTVTIQY